MFNAYDYVKWKEIKHFSPKEWPVIEDGALAGDNVLEHMDPELVVKLDRLRDAIGSPLHPSPVWKAHVRYTGTSRHSLYVTHDRISDATDFFVDWDALWLAQDLARKFFSGGIGIYLDVEYRGRPWPMMHCDLRPEPLRWVRENGVYTYLHQSPAEYHSILAE